MQQKQLFQMTQQIPQLLWSMSDSCSISHWVGKCQLGYKNLEAQFFSGVSFSDVQVFSPTLRYTTAAAQAREKSHPMMVFTEI